MTDLAPLSKYEQAIALLAEARTVDEAMSIRTEAERMRFTARQAKNKEAIADAIEIQIRAERRLGEMIISAKEAGQIQARRPGREETKRSGPEHLPRVTLAEAGIDRKLSSSAQQLARQDADRFAKVLAEARERTLSGRAIVVNPVKDLTAVDKQKKRANREWSLAQKIVALPTRKFGLIYADPEWMFATRSAKGMDRSADNHYPTSPLAALQARDVRSIAADDCVLLMWATVPMLMEAICLADAWGFALLVRDPETGFLTPDKAQARYVSGWTWFKEKMGTGYWARNEHELLLIFTRGKPVPPAMGTQPGSVWQIEAAYSEQAGEHSAKPDAFAEEIARLWPNTPKLEMNARNPREGWTVWGDEVADLAESAPVADGVAGGNPAVTSGAEVAAPLPFSSSSEVDAIIAAGYAADSFDMDVILARLLNELGMAATPLQVRRRANQKGLGDRARQKEAVSASNIRRGQGR